MKQGWEIRPFEDCIKKVKYTAKIASSDYLTTGAYPIISQEEEMISGYWDNKDDVFAVSSPVVIFGDHTRVLKYVDFDFVLGADGVKILQPIDCLDAKFLMYFLKSCKIPSLGYSRHYKLLKEISVPVPERAEQERIVGELDCLSGIIAAKRAQLRELDTLAQSIFYTMFGDPITNDKGWQTKMLGDICEIVNGFAFKSNLFTDAGDVIVRISNIKNGYVDLSDAVYFDKKDYKKINFDKYVVYPQDIVIALSGATTGKLGINNSGKKLYLNQRVAICRENTTAILKLYLLYYLHAQSLKFLSDAEGVAQPNLSTEQMKRYIIGIPPIDLQKQFAEKIENIERQKELITKSIKETEDLFNSRMDYYFN